MNQYGQGGIRTAREGNNRFDGGEYILSAHRIIKPERSGLRLLKRFDHPESAWTIWLYEPWASRERPSL
ncbi:MAG: DUF6044 family protein [Desulfatibacillaceae bacterium]